MARNVFYSFQYVPDSWRAAKVRKVNTLTDVENLVGNKWEEVRKDTNLAITRWINDQVRGTSCTIVLVGATTDSSDWVDYEIRHSWNKAPQGLFGVRIHRLWDRDNLPSSAGNNPFAKVELKDGSRLSDRVRLYDPPGLTSADVLTNVRDNIADWVETAIATK